MQSLSIKSLSQLLTLTLIFLVTNAEASRLHNNGRSVRVAEYHGQWDISAKHTAMLCEAVKRGQAGGDGVNNDNDTPLPEPERETYIKDDKCWKMRWNPCEDNEEDDRLAEDGVLSKRRKPCGYYKMVEDEDSYC